MKEQKRRRRLVIHDLNIAEAAVLFDEYDDVVSDDGAIRNCIGCFGCWLKTPGACVLGDAYSDMGRRLSRCGELLLVSRCLYGSPGPFVKNVLDRSIPYIHPYFVIRNGEMHHRRRYENAIALKAVFYGEDLRPEEKQTAREWVDAMAVNLYCDVERVAFLKDTRGLEEWI